MFTYCFLHQSLNTSWKEMISKQDLLGAKFHIALLNYYLCATRHLLLQVCKAILQNAKNSELTGIALNVFGSQFRTFT